MGLVFRNNKWHMHFRDLDGKQRFKATGTSDRKEAEDIFKAFMSSLNAQRKLKRMAEAALLPPPVRRKSAPYADTGYSIRDMRSFMAKWHGRGIERSDCHLFWLELLTVLHGMLNTDFNVFDDVEVERQLYISGSEHPKFLDIYIRKSLTLIEQKSANEGLSDSVLRQALKYSRLLPEDERPVRILLCNFRCFKVFDRDGRLLSEFNLHELDRHISDIAFLVGERKAFDNYFMEEAMKAANSSTCSRRHVAAVIVLDGHILATGYNGTPNGILDCNRGGCPRCSSDTPSGEGLEECLCSHAEENAIVYAARTGTNVSGAVMYTTLFPCVHCAKMIINAGIVEVVYAEDYIVEAVSRKLLADAGVAVRKLTQEPCDGKETDE